MSWTVASPFLLNSVYHHFWWKIWRKRGPLNSTTKDKTSVAPTQMVTRNVKKCGSRIELMQHFMTFINLNWACFQSRAFLVIFVTWTKFKCFASTAHLYMWSSVRVPKLKLVFGKSQPSWITANRNQTFSDFPSYKWHTSTSSSSFAGFGESKIGTRLHTLPRVPTFVPSYSFSKSHYYCCCFSWVLVRSRGLINICSRWKYQSVCDYGF